MTVIRTGPRGFVYGRGGGGGALKAEGLKCATGGDYERGLTPTSLEGSRPHFI